MDQELPLASEEYEQTAASMFPYETMSPEEYAGRYAHGIWSSSFDTFAYRNPALHAWIHDFHQVLRSGRVREYQMRYYTEEELARLIEESI